MNIRRVGGQGVMNYTRTFRDAFTISGCSHFHSPTFPIMLTCTGIILKCTGIIYYTLLPTTHVHHHADMYGYNSLHPVATPRMFTITLLRQQYFLIQFYQVLLLSLPAQIALSSF